VGTLRRIRWPLQPRSRDRLAAFGERNDRWMTLSRHPEPSPSRDRFTPAASDLRRPFARCGRRRFTADHRPALDLRSLPPPLFLERCARAYSRPDTAYRLLQLHFRRAGTSTRALRSSQGRRPRPPSFSDASRGFFLGSGDARRAAHRPPVPTSVPVPSACADLPDRDTDLDASPPPAFHRRSRVTIDVHGSEDRAKDVSPCARGTIASASGACASGDMPTTFPFSANPRGTRGHRRDRPQGKRPVRTRRTGQDPISSGAPRRAPASTGPGAFHRCDHEPARIAPRRILVIGLPLTPPTRTPQTGERC